MDTTNVPTTLTHHPRITLAQKAKVTLGLSALGMVGGAVAGGVSAVVVAAIIDGTPKSLLSISLFAIGAKTGVLLGAVLLPIAGWTLLRRVSFRRVIAGTVLGTMLGGLAGWFVVMDTNAFSRSVAGGVIGFVSAAIIMRLRARVAVSSASTL